jgi:hypothetical protein
MSEGSTSNADGNPRLNLKNYKLSILVPINEECLSKIVGKVVVFKVQPYLPNVHLRFNLSSGTFPPNGGKIPT